MDGTLTGNTILGQSGSKSKGSRVRGTPYSPELEPHHQM